VLRCQRREFKKSVALKRNRLARRGSSKAIKETRKRRSVMLPEMRAQDGFNLLDGVE
jgi:hypothetical protein